MEPIIEVERLTKRYKKAEGNAVDGISFTVASGAFFALLGPNGAGKTTTLSILTTTLSPTSGIVRIAGRDVTKQASAVRRDVGIIFQNPSLDLNLTAEENVRFHAILYGLYPFRPTFAMMPRPYQTQVRGERQASSWRTELQRLAIPFSENGLFRIDANGLGVHRVLKSIETPLTVVQTHAPTLEDAYLEIVKRSS
jgi:ABC-2 type transport system ATP-binding protein